LYRRKNGIYYCQFINNEAKARLAGISTRKRNRDEALLVVYRWEQDGIPPRKQNHAKNKISRPVSEALTAAQVLQTLKQTDLSLQDMPKIEKILQDKGLITLIVRRNAPEAEVFVDYLLRFWDFGKSPYVEEKLSHKMRIGRSHTGISLQRVNLYWKPYFSGKHLGEITREDVKDFSKHLAKENPSLSPLTLKRIMKVGVKALRYAYVNGYIQADPTIALMGYSSKAKKRGVLTPEEAMALFRLKWTDYRALLANLVAMSTGLRVQYRERYG
jgi:hypothetical protein